MDEQSLKENLIINKTFEVIYDHLSNLNNRLIKLELLHKKSLSKQHGGVEM
ncbi:MAG: hypothetical protein ACXWEW_11910 [Nitrososphaeraceae archaeon]